MPVCTQTFSGPIEGLYVQRGTSTGLKIEKLPDDNYIFTSIFFSPDGEIEVFEWQSAYVVKSQSNTYLFYWHTGRQYDNDPDSNGLIVYNLTFDGRRLRGTHFFPQQPLMPPMSIEFLKQ
jgi:hypothetical protein